MLCPRSRYDSPLRCRGGGGRVRGALWTTYSLFRPEHLRADMNAYLQRVVRARTAEGLPTPLYNHDLSAAINHGFEGLNPHLTDREAVLREVLAEGSEAMRRPVQGWVLQARTVADAGLPRALLVEPHLSIALVDAYWFAPDDAWARLVLFVVTTQGRSDLQPEE